MSLRLNFLITNGIAKGWNAKLAETIITSHREKYRFMPYAGPEYFNDEFINIKLEKALNNPEFVYPNIRLTDKSPRDRKQLEIREGVEWVVFYSEVQNHEVENINDGTCFVENIKVITIRDLNNKDLHIQGFRKTSHIAEKDFVKPLSDIKLTKYSTINGYSIL